MMGVCIGDDQTEDPSIMQHAAFFFLPFTSQCAEVNADHKKSEWMSISKI